MQRENVSASHCSRANHMCSLRSPSLADSGSNPSVRGLLMRPFASASPASSSSSANSATSSTTKESQPLKEAEAQPQQKSDYRFTSAASSIKLPKSTPPPHLGRPPMPRKLGRVQVPTPEKALPPEAKPGGILKKLEPQKIAKYLIQTVAKIFMTVAEYAYKTPYWTWYYATHSSERREFIAKLKDMARHEAEHYWNGTKLLVADVRTARTLLRKTLDGNALTRRERKQLLRTVSDLFRLVPFSMFIVIPFMEFALPFALRIFPNLLPSTFQDSLKAEENMKRELQSRIAMAQFFQETLEALAQEQKKKAVRRRQEMEQAGAEQEDSTIYKQEDSAASMLEFLSKARNGEMIPPDVIIRYANYFQDDLTLDNMPRMQLINMCRYMNIPPYGADSFLRFQLRHRIRSLKEDDQRILWEGIDSLTKMELREAVQERGMRSTGLSKDAYKRALQQWLDLSVNKNVPIALLIMSRTFFLQDEIPSMPRASKDTATKTGKETKTLDASSSNGVSSETSKTVGEFAGGLPKSDASLTGLADAISGLDKQVLNEVILTLATSEEKTSDPEIRKLKLEVLEKQNELIRKEQEDREEEKKHQQQAATGSSFEDASTISARPVLEATAQEPEISVSGSSGSGFSPDSQTIEKPEQIAAEENTDGALTTEEMDALRTILTDDPVSSEREALEKIKAAMKGDMKPQQREELQRIRESIESHASEEEWCSLSQKYPSSTDKAAESRTSEEVNANFSEQQNEDQQFSTSSTQGTESKNNALGDREMEDELDDPIVARLKQRVESMVDKIELQLSQTQVKIGDKMHLLDKDRDGILTREEVAEVLEQVFKKNISFEEAMEIANEMVRIELVTQILANVRLRMHITKLTSFSAGRQP